MGTALGIIVAILVLLYLLYLLICYVKRKKKGYPSFACEECANKKGWLLKQYHKKYGCSCQKKKE